MVSCGWNGYQFDRSKLLIFAKSPVAGQVKTRMQPVLSEQQSAQLHCQLLTHCLKNMKQGGLVESELWVSDADYDWQQWECEVRLQSGSDLGQRMFHAASETLRENDSVVIIGADCPFINRQYVQQALEALAEGYDCVLGPATDGGYVLIGLSTANKIIFSNIDWGSEQVFTQTLQQIKKLQWKYKKLSKLSDIDRPADLKQLDSLPAFRRWLSYGQ